MMDRSVRFFIGIFVLLMFNAAFFPAVTTMEYAVQLSFLAVDVFAAVILFAFIFKS